MYIDTHCHLDFENFDGDRESVVQRSIKNKIEAIITIGTSVETSIKAIELSKKFATVFAAVGIHPNDAANVNQKSVQKIYDISSNPKVVAIGEIGLDYYRKYTSEDVQKELFRTQLKIAREKELPVIIHNREAHADVYDILVQEKSSDLKGVLHSFDGDAHFLDSILSYNFYISFTGVITFKNTNFEEIIKRVPLENLLLETDSPFLTPVPFRGKRNEPSYVTYVAEKIAQIKEISVEELAKITSANARKLFKFKH
jgi:TatD DNase family protein